MHISKNAKVSTYRQVAAMHRSAGVAFAYVENTALVLCSRISSISVGHICQMIVPILQCCANL